MKPFLTIIFHHTGTSSPTGSLRYVRWRGERGVLITPIATLMGRLCPLDYLERYSFAIQVGASVDLDDMRIRLTRAGYRNVSQVVEHGEFAVRGSLLDLFPMGAHTPLRLDLFDDEVEAIRRFDPETQRSTDSVDAVDLLPARESRWTRTLSNTSAAHGARV